MKFAKVKKREENNGNKLEIMPNDFSNRKSNTNTMAAEDLCKVIEIMNKEEKNLDHNVNKFVIVMKVYLKRKGSLCAAEYRIMM